MRKRTRAIKEKQRERDPDESAAIIFFFFFFLKETKNIVRTHSFLLLETRRLTHARVKAFVLGLPGHVHGHILVRGSGQDAEQLVEDGGQKVDHHVTLHRMETLWEGGRGEDVRHVTFPLTLDYKIVFDETSMKGVCCVSPPPAGVFFFFISINYARSTFRYFTSSPSKACSDSSML